MSRFHRIASPEGLKTCKPSRYGHSHLIKLPNSKTFIVIGPHWPGVVVTTAIIIGATMMNIRYIRLNQNLSLFTSFTLYMIIVIGFISSNTFLWMTALTNPGIVFPEEHPADSQDVESSNHILLSQPGNRFYCDVCNMQEPRGVLMDHCYTCGYCIENMDHHCPWMGQCVGKKNMKWFILFNVSWVLYFLEFIFTVIVLKF